MKRFLKEMIGILGLTVLISSQSPVLAAENALSKVLTEQQILKTQTFSMPTEDQNKELADKVEEIIQYLDLDGKDDYSKIFAIYNYVCQNVEYDWAATDVDPSEWDGGLGYGQLAYEALCEGKAVCAGIARSVDLLLTRAGISSYYVAGTEWGVAHAWNLVELDGIYYFVDATSDLNKDTYKYFLKCENDLSEHVYTLIEGLDDVSSIQLAEKSYCDTVDGSYEKAGDYLINGGRGDIIIHSYTGNEENVIVPAEINGRKVKGIAQYAFSYCPEMKTLTISEGVERIASLFVNWAPNLVKVSLPVSAGLYSGSSDSFNTGISGFIQQCESLEVIEVPEENPYLTVIDGALYDKALTTLIMYPAASKIECVKIPDGVTHIAGDAFSVNEYIKKVVFPDSVTTIDGWAFNGCSALEEINIPANCKNIGQYAFCKTAIKHIKIPATVVDAIAAESFMGTPVETIEVEEGNPYYYVEDGALYAGENVLLMYAAGREESEFVVPEGVEFICSGAFYGSLNLQKITIASTVKTITDTCFYDCRQLKEVSIKEGALEEIEPYAFMNCERLQTINIPNSVSTIGRSAFCQCDALTEIILPEGLKEINENLFNFCKQLTTVGIPGSVTVIRNGAFERAIPKNIYYSESEDEWEQIDKGDNDFTGSKIFFNGEICNHIWSDELAIDIEPTCEEKGQESIHCTVCGLMKKGTELEIPAKGHEFGEWLNPTESCGIPVTEIRYCRKCGSSEERVTLGHALTYYSGTVGDETIEFWHCDKCDKNFADEQGIDQIEIADGWIEMPDGMHYLQSGTFLANSWLTVDGYTYYLGNDGIPLYNTRWILYEDLTFYQFDENGHLLINCWYSEGIYRYYYGADGKGYTGIKEIEGDIYYFYPYWGEMESNIEITEDGTRYYFGADGKLEWKLDVSSDGWKTRNGGWYYVQDGQILKYQWLTVDGNTYYLTGTGRRLENGSWSLADEVGAAYEYRFDENGCVVTGWYEELGKKYYYDTNGRKIKNSVVQIGGAYFGFDDMGQQYVDCEFGCGAHSYRAKQDGTLYVNEWYERSSRKYYYGEGGVAYIGIKEIEGDIYYISYWEGMQSNVEITENGVLYYFGADGKLEWKLDISSDGWKTENDGWYYVQDGRILRSQWLTVDGYTYYLSDDGKMLANEERLLQDPNGEESHVYRFAPNGAMVTGWYQLENGDWQYRDGNGIVKTGWVYLNNIWYYLNEEGIMATGWKVVNGARYFFNESGVMQTGWLQLETTWYYLSDSGAMVTSWLNLNGTWYYLDASGAMVTDWLNLNGTWYYMTSSGSMAIGWCAVDGMWYYLSESGAMVTGWLNLGGTWYYMNASGVMLIGTHVINGNTYVFDQNGAWAE